jgi:Cof subfamily protein (haloacid dehalogenase superfamily)
VSQRTRATLAAAQDSGVEVVFVTGRPLSMLSEILTDTGHTGTVIGANGAVQLDAVTQLPQRVSAFPTDAVEGIWTSLANTFPRGAYVSMMWHPDGSADRSEGIGPAYLSEVSRRLETGWQFYKLLVLASDDHTVESAVAQAGTAIGDATEVTHSSDALPLVEISPKGVTKGTALASYASSRGLPLAAVHAIGDMPNDLPMLAVAGTSYAPANAHERVRAIVDVVLGSNEADSVARLLEELLERHG